MRLPWYCKEGRLGRIGFRDGQQELQGPARGSR